MLDRACVGRLTLLAGLLSCAVVSHALPKHNHKDTHQIALPHYMAINGLSLQALKSKHLGATIELNDLNIDQLIHTKKMLTARFSVARARIDFPKHVAKNPQKQSTLLSPQVYTPLRRLTMQDLVVKTGVDLSDQLWLGRHRITANQMDLMYTQSDLATKIHGLSLNYALSAKGKRLASDMDLKIQRLTNKKTDVGPVHMVLSLNRLNRQAFHQLMQQIKPLSKKADQLQSMPPAVNTALQHLVEKGMRADLSQFKWVTHDGTLTAQARLVMPVQKKSHAATWPDLLRTGVLSADIEVDRRLMQKTVKQLLQRGLMNKMRQVGIKSKIKVSDDEVSAMLALWKKTGLLKVKHQRYLFHCHYEKGAWKINGHQFPVKKTTWWPRKLFYGWFGHIHPAAA